VLALLAFACVPALAQAEVCDASCKAYKIDIPKSGVEEPQHPKSGGGTAPESMPDKPRSGGEGAESRGTRPDHEPESEEKQVTGGGGAGGGDGDGPGKGGTAKGDDAAATGKPRQTPHQAEPLGSETAPTHSGGGSSPLVPALVAVAVLAAISFGVVFYRQRRQGRPA
jgi:hypothetical protein